MQRKHKVISRTIIALVGSATAVTASAKGGIIDTEFADLHFLGGASAGYYAGNNEVTRQNDQNRLSDFLLGMHASTEDKRAEVSAGIGILPSYSLLDHGVDNTTTTAEVQYATLVLHPLADLTIELGRISSNIGYENTPSYLNAHSVGSVQSTTQPGYYPGTRLTFGSDMVAVYVEQSDDSFEAPSAATTGQSWSTGVMGTLSDVEYVVGYQSYVDLRSMFDLILSGSLAGMDVTFSYDRLSLTNTAVKNAGDNKHAESVAIYLSGPTFNEISIPVRLEAFDDHGNNIYEGAGKGHSLTVTPTWNLSEHAYVRTDFSYIKMDNKILKNNTTGNRFMFILQAGYRI